MGLPPIQGEELAMVDLTPPVRPMQQQVKPMTLTAADSRQVNSVNAQYAKMHKQGAALFNSED